MNIEFVSMRAEGGGGGGTISRLGAYYLFLPTGLALTGGGCLVKYM